VLGGGLELCANEYMEDVFKCMQVAEKLSRKRAMPAGTDLFSPMGA
jgi:hypothetical protein